jgi:hypothetical protein
MIFREKSSRAHRPGSSRVKATYPRSVSHEQHRDPPSFERLPRVPALALGDPKDTAESRNDLSPDPEARVSPAGPTGRTRSGLAPRRHRRLERHDFCNPRVTSLEMQWRCRGPNLPLRRLESVAYRTSALPARAGACLKRREPTRAAARPIGTRPMNIRMRLFRHASFAGKLQWRIFTLRCCREGAAADVRSGSAVPPATHARAP